jgi:plastocyanin
MPPLVRHVASAFVVASALHGSAGIAATARAATHTVVMDGTAFSPATMTVKAGDRVVWRNKDPFPHTATAKGVFDSGSIAAGGKWTYTVRKRGEFDYVCTLHPTMKGRLVVR